MKNNVVISKYMPFTLNMHYEMESIFNSTDDIKLTNIIDYPKSSLGFQHYIHSLKKDSLDLKKFENKKKVYLVTNKFEIDVDNYDNCISKEVNKFLEIKDKTPKIISLDYYKIWEILFMFELINIDTPLDSLYLTDDGSSSQAVMYFREKYAKNIKSDIYDILKNQYINSEFINYFGKTKNIKQIDKISNKYDLVVCGISFNKNEDMDVNTLEQEYFKTLFENLMTLIENIKKNGSCIIKIFETFTNISAKFFCILNSLFDKIFVSKPLTSRDAYSEKFIVCTGFRFNDKDKNYDNIHKKIKNIISQLDRNPKLKLRDIFNKYELNKNYNVRLIKLNTHLSNMYFKGVGENVNFVNGQNYYGDKYQQFRDAQIEANNYWAETYLPESKDFKEIKKKILENSYNSNKINMDDIIKLEKELN
jgi:23S rRNA U2552 (ribose-2'-O)-methylase RlmE/FtsJ